MLVRIKLFLYWFFSIYIERQQRRLNLKITCRAGQWWLMPVILTTWAAEFGRIKVRGQSGQIVQETPSPKELEQNGLTAWLKQ
jgi:hypothetical protein